MPITADPVTIAQIKEPEANVDLVTELTVNPNAEVFLATPVGQNDNSMAPDAFARWMNATGELVSYTHPDHTGMVTSVGDGPTTIVDDVITLSMLTAGARANLSIGTHDADEFHIDNTQGSGVVIPSATTSLAGLLDAARAGKLDTWVSVTDPRFAGGADPTGAADSSAAVQAAIDYAVANLIGYVWFPYGVYQINQTIDLPIASSGTNRRLTIDLGNSLINTTNAGAVFSRSIADIGDTDTRFWMPTIVNGTFVQQGGQQGTAILIEKASNVFIQNLRFSGFLHAIKLAFCLHHRVDNVNAVDCLQPFVCANSTGNFTNPTNDGSNSNLGLWTVARCQCNNPAAIGFQIIDSRSVWLQNCTVEGSNISKCVVLDGVEENGSTRGVKKEFRVDNLWIEMAAIQNTVIELKDCDKTTFFLHVNGSSYPTGPRFLTLDNTIRSVINISAASLFADIANHTSPWFDADIKSLNTQQNVWNFIDNMVGTGERMTNPARWVDNSGRQVPFHTYERSFDYNSNLLFDTILTAQPNSLLLNADASSEALVKSTQINSLPVVSPGPGVLSVVEDAAGNLGRADLGDVSATSRGDGSDDLGTYDGSGGPLVIDFDSGNYFNKIVTAAADFQISLLATTAIQCDVQIVQDATGFRQLTVNPAQVWPRITNLPLAPNPGDVTVIRFRYNPTTGLFYWGLH